MAKPQFMYVTYIETTADKAWEALTSGDFTERYWGGGRIESTWQVGAPVRHVKHERGMDWEGEVLEYDPPRRLAYTMTAGKDDQPSRVAFTLEPHGSIVKLTVTHDQLDDKGLRDISFGWPAILSSLKSFLETGKPLTYERWW